MKIILSILLLVFLSCGTSSNLTNRSNDIEFSKKGILKSKGLYKVGSVEDCGPGGVERIEYKYRTGKWIFYHNNGKVRAVGKYQNINSTIDTRCREKKNFTFSKIDDNWHFFDKTGIKISPTRSRLIN